jgi:DNA polymerase
MNDKRDKYLKLVAVRKTCALCQGLENPSRCAGGKYDSGEIGVWSGWQGGLDALVMIVGQDWGAVRNFQLQHGVDIASATIKMLCELLALAGLKAELPSGQTQRGDLFSTNAVLCLKHGGDQAKVRPEWIRNCSNHFLRPQIEIIQPKLIVCLGQVAYEAVLKAYGHRCGRFRDAVEREAPLELPGGTKTVAVYHCGRRILNTHRKLEAQRLDWQRVGVIVQRLRGEHVGNISCSC